MTCRKLQLTDIHRRLAVCSRKRSRLDEPEWEDYLFTCEKDHADETAKLLTELYFKEEELWDDGCLKCLVKHPYEKTEDERKGIFSYEPQNSFFTDPAGKESR